MAQRSEGLNSFQQARFQIPQVQIFIRLLKNVLMYEEGRRGVGSIPTRRSELLFFLLRSGTKAKTWR